MTKAGAAVVVRIDIDEETETAHTSPATPLTMPTVLQFHRPADAPPPRLASSLPDSMIAEIEPFNLLEDIRQAQAQYSAAGREKIALYGFPSFLTTNIRRVLSRNRNHKADWAVALSCLVWNGLLRYSAMPGTRKLSAALLDLDMDDEIGTLAAEQVEMWRRGFKFAVSDPTHTMGLEKVRSWKAPEHVHSELFDMAGRLGLSGSTLGTVCVMASLEHQEGVLPDHARFMRESVAELDGLIEERGKRLAGLCKAIEAGVWD